MLDPSWSMIQKTDVTTNMKLKELKEKATVSELGLIDAVERLVREEYDIDSMRKNIHSKLKDDIYEKVNRVLESYHLIGECTRSNYKLSYHDGEQIRTLLGKLGEAVRLEVSRDD